MHSTLTQNQHDRTKTSCCLNFIGWVSSHYFLFHSLLATNTLWHWNSPTHIMASLTLTPLSHSPTSLSSNTSTQRVTKKLSFQSPTRRRLLVNGKEYRSRRRSLVLRRSAVDDVPVLDPPPPPPPDSSESDKTEFIASLKLKLLVSFSILWTGWSNFSFCAPFATFLVKWVILNFVFFPLSFRSADFADTVEFCLMFVLLMQFMYWLIRIF